MGLNRSQFLPTVLISHIWCACALVSKWLVLAKAIDSAVGYVDLKVKVS